MTHRSRRLEFLDADLELLASRRTVLDDAVARLMAARPGYPAAVNYDTATGRGTASSPTERLLSPNGDLIDPTARDRHQLDECLRLVHRGAVGLANVVDAWAPKAADDKARRQSEEANALPDPECTNCARLGHHEPLHPRSDANGNLAEPMDLGRRCYDFARAHGRLPIKAELDRWEKGLQVRVPA